MDVLREKPNSPVRTPCVVPAGDVGVGDAAFWTLKPHCLPPVRFAVFVFISRHFPKYYYPHQVQEVQELKSVRSHCQDIQSPWKQKRFLKS